MIKEAFLVCALALPLMNVNINIEIKEPKEYELLVGYAREMGCNVMELRQGIHPVPEGTIMAPFRYRGMSVYLRKSA